MPPEKKSLKKFRKIMLSSWMKFHKRCNFWIANLKTFLSHHTVLLLKYVESFHPKKIEYQIALHLFWKKNIDRYLHDPTKARFQIVKYKTTTHYAHRCFQNFIDVFASVKRIKILSMADTREVKHLQRLKALYTAGRFVPNALDQQGLCHIHHAAYRGYLVCTKWLIKRGSSLTAR